MLSIITVEVMIFPAPPPNSQRSSAFPVLTRQWPGRDWFYSLSSLSAAVFRSPCPQLSTCQRHKRLVQWKGDVYSTSILEVKTNDPEGLWQHENSWTHLKPSRPGPRKDARPGKLLFSGSSPWAWHLQSRSSGDGWIALHPCALFWLFLSCLNCETNNLAWCNLHLSEHECWCSLKNHSPWEPKISLLIRKVTMGSQSSLGGLTITHTQFKSCPEVRDKERETGWW